jgi:dCTP deaminase
MLLSDLEIVERLCTKNQERRVVITPLLDEKQIQSASIDLRLGFHFKTVKTTGVGGLDPLSKNPRDLQKDTERYTTDIKLDPGQPFFIHPGEFALGTTLEYVAIPDDLAATLEGRSSLGRLGITVHSTAGFIDPGFAGRITYEIQNEGTQAVGLYPGMRVAQLCLLSLSSRSIRAYGKSLRSKYNQQLTTTSSRWFDDSDLKKFRSIFRPERTCGCCASVVYGSANFCAGCGTKLNSGVQLDPVPSNIAHHKI